MTTLDVVAAWGAAKELLSQDLGLTHSMLHVLAGLALYPIIAWLFRARRASWWPVLGIAVLEGVNEIADHLRYALSHWPGGPQGTVSDIALTLLPITLVVAVWRAVRAVRARADAAADDADGGRTAAS